MKTMTKFLLTIIIIFFSFQSYAQIFGIKAGLNLSNMSMKDNDDTYSDDFEMNPGFHVGGTMDYPFSDILSLETGLFLDTKGFKWDNKEGDEEGEVKVNLYYLDIPITLKGSFEVGSGGVKIYGAAGPYIGMGLSGKFKSEYSYQGEKESEEEDVEWGDDGDFKRLDYGLTFGAGVEFSAFQLGVSYDLGLANISAYSDNGNTIKNNVLKFSVGYRFMK